MKSSTRSFMTLLIVVIFSLSLFTAAGAESAADTILKTGTTQAFAADAVPEEDIRTILQAGVSTASAINQQPWYFVAITNQDLMKEIGGSGMGFGGGRPAVPAGGAGGAKASLGDSPLAIIVYMNTASRSPSPEYDCGLATQNMVIAASALGYGVKIVSSPTMSLNGANHDQICEKLGIDTGLKAVAVLLIGKDAAAADAVSSASVRDELDAKSVIIP